MNWKLKSDSEHRTIYIDNSRYGINAYLMFNKELCNCDYYIEEFVYKDDMWKAQQAETNEAVKWSCKYGHWEVRHPAINIELTEFILDKLKALKEQKG